MNEFYTLLIILIGGLPLSIYTSFVIYERISIDALLPSLAIIFQVTKVSFFVHSYINNTYNNTYLILLFIFAAIDIIVLIWNIIDDYVQVREEKKKMENAVEEIIEYPNVSIYDENLDTFSIICLAIRKVWMYHKDQEIRLEDNLQYDLDLDSLESLELIMELEDLFKIECPTHDVFRIKTVEDVKNLIDGIIEKTKNNVSVGTQGE